MNNNSNTPVIGTGANVFGWSDIKAFTVVSVNAKGTVAVLQRDTATLLNGVDSGEPDALKFFRGGFVGHITGRQRYAYERDANGEKVRVSLRKNGEWRVSGAHGARVEFGDRSEHYDFNF